MDKELAITTLEELVSSGNAPPEVIQELLELIMENNDNFELVKQDYLKAYEWYSRAAEQGNKNAIKGKSSVEKLMSPSQKDELKRFKN